MSKGLPGLNHGIYADWIERYVAYKQSLGYQMDDFAIRLRSFDRLTLARGEAHVGISKDLFDAWAAPRPAESATTRYGRIARLRQFSTYLELMGHPSYVPRLPKYVSTFTPHIYTQGELTALFQASDRLFLKRRYLFSSLNVVPTLLRLLYGTGLRVSEAMRLTHQEVDLDTGCLLIRTSKNGRQRVVPITRSLIEVCKDFVAYQQQQGVAIDPGQLFFTSLNGMPCQAQTMYEHFRTVLYKAGLAHHGRGGGPRLHDLRHTFCVHALVQMAETGLDLYVALPLLSTYVGHQSIEATNRYVRLTTERFPHLLAQVNRVYPSLFPNLALKATGEMPL